MKIVFKQFETIRSKEIREVLAQAIEKCDEIKVYSFAKDTDTEIHIEIHDLKGYEK